MTVIKYRFFLYNHIQIGIKINVKIYEKAIGEVQYSVVKIMISVGWRLTPVTRNVNRS